MREGERAATYRPVDTAKKAKIGAPGEIAQRDLKRAGYLLAAADLVWIPQAALIAATLGTLLHDLQGGTEEPVLSDVVLPLVGFIVLALLRSALQYVSSNVARQAARSVQEIARADLLRVATRLSPAAEFPSSGAFAAHLTEQVDFLGPYYRNFVPQSVRLKFVPLAIVLTTLVFSWLAALILLICGPMIPVFMALIGMRAKAASAKQQEELTRLSGILMDRVKGLETLKLFGALSRTEAVIAEAGEAFRLGTMRVLKIAFLSSTVLELFSALGIAFCAVYIGFTLLGELHIGTWGAPLSFQTGLFLLLLAPEFFAPLRAYAAAYHDRAAGLAAMEKLSGLFESIADDRAADGVTSARRNCLSSPPVLAFENVSLRFGAAEVFRNLNLTVNAGETVLVSGPSGAGKTTLLDFLLGYVKPSEGAVFVDGHRAAALPDLNSSVLWLGQSPRLFHGSLRSNLLKAIGQDGVAPVDEDFWDALELAGAANLVHRLPRGLDTVIGENGFGLSVGEIRRIALARAAMRQSGTLLLADEPTAGLDAETAADVIGGLAALAKKRTAVIASHDPAVLAMPGRLVDLDVSAVCKQREAVP